MTDERKRDERWEYQAMVAAARARTEDADGYAEDVGDLDAVDAAGVDDLDEWKP